MSYESSTHSRRKTPWDGINAGDRTPLQTFLYQNYLDRYEARHPALAETNEAALVNGYEPQECPYCGSGRFVRAGLDKNGLQRYRCAEEGCKRRFTLLTGTIFDAHRISITEWIEFTLNILRYLSINADSWNNRNTINTSRYWINKLFYVAAAIREEKILSGEVQFDETYIPLASADLERNEDGSRLRGISNNQMCIGVAYDGSNAYCIYEGLGPPTSERTLEAFRGHIEPGSILIHDMEPAHNLLVRELGLESRAYNSKEIKKLPDNLNPLNEVNTLHSRLQSFLGAHPGFKRDTLQGYLDLFSLAFSSPEDPLLKLEIVLDVALNLKKVLRYRDFYGSKELMD